MPKTPEYTRTAVNNYRKKYDFIQIRFPKGTRAIMEESGIGNINDYISGLVMEDLKRRGIWTDEKNPSESIQENQDAETIQELQEESESLSEKLEVLNNPRNPEVQAIQTADQMQEYIARMQAQNAARHDAELRQHRNRQAGPV